MSNFGPAYDSDIPPGHPAQERRSRHPVDRRLRGRGFRIEHRPAGGQAVWSREGRTYLQGQAVEIMLAENQAEREKRKGACAAGS